MAVLHAIATARGQPAVLAPAELAGYSAALGSHRAADRMAIAAELVGDGEEASFWRRLPATLAWLGATLAAQARRRTSVDGRPPLGSSSAGAAPGASGALHSTTTTSGGGRRLWDEGLELAEALERSSWHEQMNRRVFEDSEDLQVGVLKGGWCRVGRWEVVAAGGMSAVMLWLPVSQLVLQPSFSELSPTHPCPLSMHPQEKRVLEYVALGDFQTAVGFLLASPPDRSQRYYRDALATLGMAFACGLQQAGLAGGSGGGGVSSGAPAATAAATAAAEDSAARTLFVQAAKVITANAASVGDTLLGVPLLCSTGGLFFAGGEEGGWGKDCVCHRHLAWLSTANPH